MLIGYASTLLASPLDAKKKRTGTYLERVTPIEEPKKNKGKAVPSVSTPITSTNLKVTKRSPAKKKPKIIPKKFFERKWKSKNHSLEEEDTEPDIQTKKTRQSNKRTKSIGNIPATLVPINIDIPSYKPMTHCQRTIKNIKRKVLDDLKEYFDDFNDSEKEEVE